MTRQFEIFLIDDDPDDQEIFLSVIDTVAPAATCSTAFNGQEAIERLSDPAFRPDVIFLDLNMPLMNGKQFLVNRNSIEALREIPVIILSTSSDQSNINETRRLGAKYFITKPDRYTEWELVLKKFFSEEFDLIRRN